MAEQDNIEAAQAWIEAWNKGDLSGIDQYEADNLVAENPGGIGPLNRDQNRAYIQNFLNAFPNSKMEVVLTVVQGDYVVTNWKITAKNAGPLVSPSGATISPTGKMVTTFGSSTAQMKNAKMVHSWVFFDMASLFGQMGLMPPM